ncbi:UDP-N-acetylmuramate dehydrogenase [Vibrio sp. S11_S32]|uniref:UDP-N-acetylmuramate dehydrogenase n=1 Tax=Vibrio sp. S11_S32 TaxID=2720225 RepID=UPI001680C9A0|nr:UDP-N-acetylmuramate dehydrogenase [Vibrio sp. S11_S32]MBD1577926.1 UDP-N-acetylmuramate dehydrogenase [Vibrio sp. S11_S32]
MNVNDNVNLKPFHTFGIDMPCDTLIEATTIEDIAQAFQSMEWIRKPKLLLGKGSNVLFTEPYQGVVIVNHLQGKTLTEKEGHYHLHISGGEDWPSLVDWTLEQGIGGLENLALIPGCAGSAPIQNIGAYGVEFKDVCEYVDYLDLADFKVKRLSAAECCFSYRDSIFKQALYNKVVITAVGLVLSKEWCPNLSYGPLAAHKDLLNTPKSVSDLVCEIRRSKLPDPAVMGNAGSFFKNPIISHEHYQQLKIAHPEMSGYETEVGVKIAAGWLIDRCGLKGHQVGGAQVHPQQALVLVNTGTASAKDVLDLAWFIKQSVKTKYGVELEHEVRFFTATEESKLDVILQESER